MSACLLVSIALIELMVLVVYVFVVVFATTVWFEVTARATLLISLNVTIFLLEL